VTWRRAQMVLLSAEGMDVPAIAKVAFTSEDRVRDVVRNFNADGFDSLYPKYRGPRVLLRQEGVSFQRLKTWKASKDPRYAEKKARVEHLYAVADREAAPEDGDPEAVFCVDEFGPLNLRPCPGRQWAAVSEKNKDPGRAPRPRVRATYTRTARVRHLFAAYERGEDRLYGHIKPRKTRARFLEFCRYLRSLYPHQSGSRSSATTSART
jgi:hypothetical protein